MTFPASDPIAIGGATRTEIVRQRRPPEREPDEAAQTAAPARPLLHSVSARRVCMLGLAALFLGFAPGLAGEHPGLANDVALIPSARSPVSSVLGIQVLSAGKPIGRIVDLLARPDGSIDAAVIEYGGFLGIGSRKVAVAWPELRLQHEGQQLVATTDLTAEQLATRPEYKNSYLQAATRGH